MKAHCEVVHYYGDQRQQLACTFVWSRNWDGEVVCGCMDQR